MKDYKDYGNTIDKVNDLGNAYDGLLRGERPDSPARRRSSAYSPTKRTSVTSSPCESNISERNVCETVGMGLLSVYKHFFTSQCSRYYKTNTHTEKHQTEHILCYHC